jgi:ribosome-interacting GTPase 1
MALLQINATVKLTKIDEKAIKTILAGYKIHNCDVRDALSCWQIKY